MNEELKVIISAEVAKFKQGVENAKQVVSDFVKEGTKDFGKLTDEFQKVGDKANGFLKGVGGAVAGAATAFAALGPATAELRENQAKLAAAFETAGASAGVATGVYNDLYRVLGDDGQAVEAANHLAKLTTEEQALSEWTTICQGIYATFGDSLPIEGLTEAANETAKVGTVTGGLADALNWAGISEDEFNEKLAATNSEAEREQLIRETLNGVYTDAAATYEETAADILAQNEAQAKMNEAMAELGAVAAPVMTMLSEFATEVLAELTPYIKEFADKYGPQVKEALSGIGEAVGKVITWIADNWELVSTLAAIVLGIAAAISVFSTVMGIVNAVMMASPVTWIVLAIVAALAALVAIIVVVIKHWDEIKAATLKVWNAIVSAVKTAVDKVVQFFKNLWQGIVNIATNIWNNITTIFNNIKEIIVKYIQTAKDIVLGIFDAIKNGIKNRIDTVKAVISNVVKLIKAIFTGDFGAAKEAVLGIFDGIKNGIKNSLNNAKDLVKGIIDKIKGFFSFTVSLPKIKLPHFSIKPAGWKIGDLLKGSIPSLGIEWYAKGGVFEKPTLFGYGNGAIGGLGENGAEAVVPLENNTQWLSKLAKMLNSEMGGGRPIVLQVDSKTFAEISVDSINQLTRQRGSLPLTIM